MSSTRSKRRGLRCPVGRRGSRRARTVISKRSGALLVARRSGRDVRIKYLNQFRHLGFTAPDELSERLRGVSRDRLARTAASLRPTTGSDTVLYATKLAIQTLGRRVLDLETDSVRLDRL